MHKVIEGIWVLALDFLQHMYPLPVLRIRSIFFGSASNLGMVLMFNKIKKNVWHFLTKSNHLMTLKIKDTKLFGRNCILDNDIKRENLNYKCLFVDKGSGSGSG